MVISVVMALHKTPSHYSCRSAARSGVVIVLKSYLFKLSLGHQLDFRYFVDESVVNDERGSADTT